MVTLKRHNGPLALTSEHATLRHALDTIAWDHVDGSRVVYEICEGDEIIMDHKQILEACGL